jgi:hypothetical protein
MLMTRKATPKAQQAHQCHKAPVLHQAQQAHLATGTSVPRLTEPLGSPHLVTECLDLIQHFPNIRHYIAPVHHDGLHRSNIKRTAHRSMQQNWSSSSHGSNVAVIARAE